MTTEQKVHYSRGLQVLLEVLRATSQAEIEAATGVPQSIISLIASRHRLPGRKSSVGLQRIGIEPGWWDEVLPEPTEERAAS